MTSEIRHEWIEVEADNGRKFRSYLAIPDTTPAVGVVMVHEIFGLNSTIRKLASMFDRARMHGACTGPFLAAGGSR